MMKLQRFLDYALGHQINFASYRLPNQTDIHTIVGDEVIQDDLERIKGRGFLLQPFDGQSVFLRSTYQFTNELFSLNRVSDFRQVPRKIPLALPRTMSKAAYLQKCTAFIEAIRLGAYEKLILSRPILTNLELSVSEIFQALTFAYPNAFVYVTQINGFGTWVGATPELFLKTRGQQLQTVALAGTQPVGQQNWSYKERKEQAYVTDFIREALLSGHCKNLALDGPEPVIAGPVAHLKTTITARFDQNIKSIIRSLHPTPAVCGIPKEKAKDYILANEGYDRKFYSGFLGPVDDHLHFYVNLRCMEVIDNRCCIYVGSGITAESTAEGEWEETVLKSQTLLSMLEAINC